MGQEEKKFVHPSASYSKKFGKQPNKVWEEWYKELSSYPAMQYNIPTKNKGEEKDIARTVSEKLVCP